MNTHLVVASSPNRISPAGSLAAPRGTVRRVHRAGLAWMALAAALIATLPAHAGAAADHGSARAVARQLLADLAAGRVLPATEGAEAPAAAGVDARPWVERAAESGPPAIVGTWYVTVPGPDGEVAFNAYQTFEVGGTFTETSSLLGGLPEGPAHGGWYQVGRNRFLLTFELFTFDEAGAPSGRVRVRARLTHRPLTDTLDADTTVDVITPDGTLIPAVATGPYSATRVKVLAP